MKYYNKIIIIIFFMYLFLKYIAKKLNFKIIKNFQTSTKIIINNTSMDYYYKNYPTNVDIKKEQDEITLVSAFYMVKSKRTVFYYINKLNNLFKLNKSIVFFTEKGFMKVAKDLRPKNLYNKTVFIETEIKDFLSYKKFGNIFENAFKNVNKQLHSFPLYLVWAEKCNFVRKAIIKNYFNSKCFYWIDSGWFRESEEMINFINKWPTPKKCIEDNRVLINFVGNISNKVKKGIMNFEIDMIKKLIGEKNVAGGMFGGQKEKLIKYINLYYESINLFEKHKLFIGKEQNLFAYVALKHPEIVKIIESKGDYFIFKKYLT